MGSFTNITDLRTWTMGNLTGQGLINQFNAGLPLGALGGVQPAMTGKPTAPVLSYNASGDLKISYGGGPTAGGLSYGTPGGTWSLGGIGKPASIGMMGSATNRDPIGGPSNGGTVAPPIPTPSIPQELPEVITPITRIRNTPIPVGRGKRRVNGRVIWRRHALATTVIAPETPTEVVLVPVANQNGPAPGAVRLDYNPYQYVLDGALTEADLYKPPLSSPWFYSNGGRTVWGPVATYQVQPVAGPTTPVDNALIRAAWAFGYRLDPDIDPGLTAIHANNMVIYDPTSGPVEGVSVDYYSGTEDQDQDAHMLLQDGADKTPAYRGMIYAVIGFDASIMGNFNNTEPVITASFQDQSYTYATTTRNFDFILGFDPVARKVWGLETFATRTVAGQFDYLYELNMKTGVVRQRPTTLSDEAVEHNSVYLPWAKQLAVKDALGSAQYRVQIVDTATGNVVCTSDYTPSHSEFQSSAAGACRGPNGKTYICYAGFFTTRLFVFEYDPVAKTCAFLTETGGNLGAGWIAAMGRDWTLSPGPDPFSLYWPVLIAGDEWAVAKITPTSEGVTVTDTGWHVPLRASQIASWFQLGFFWRPTTSSFYMLTEAGGGGSAEAVVQEFVDPGGSRTPIEVAYASGTFDSAFVGGYGGSSARIAHFNQAIGDAVIFAAATPLQGHYRLLHLDDGTITTATIAVGAPTFLPTNGVTFGSITTAGLRAAVVHQQSTTAQQVSSTTLASSLAVSAALISLAKLVKLDPDNVVVDGVDDTVEGITLTAGVDPVDFWRNAGRIFGFDFYERGQQIVFRKTPISPAPVPDWSDIPVRERVMFDANGSTVSAQQGERQRPAVIELSYVDSSIQFQASTARARSQSTDSAQVERFTTAFIMEAAAASTQAALALLDTEVSSETHEHELGPKYLPMEPGDVAQWAVDGKTYITKVTGVTINADLSVHVEHRNLLTERDFTFSGYAGEAIDDHRATVGPRYLFVQPGARGITGVDVSFRFLRTLRVQVGARAIAGVGVGLVGTHLPLDVVTGSRAITGVGVALGYAAPPLVVDAGTRSITGVAVALDRSAALGLATGTRSISGVALGLSYGRTMGVATGSYTYTGVDAVLTYTPSGPTNAVLLVNGVDFLMLVNGTDYLLLV